MNFINNIKVLLGSDSKKTETAIPKLAKKILIIEDEKALADILGSKFTDEGFEVMKADNGQVGLETIRQFMPDIVLLDLVMPVMDGKKMLHLLRQDAEFKNLPVIVLSNAGDINNIHETQFDYDSKDFLIKSNVDMQDIVVRVKQALGA